MNLAKKLNNRQIAYKNPETARLFMKFSQGASEFPRIEIIKKLWDYIKVLGLQTKTENGAAKNAGEYIVADAKLVSIFKNTKSTSKSGKLTDLTRIREGETINMVQMATVVGANVE